LVFASAFIPTAVYEVWAQQYKSASLAMADRQQKIDEVAELIEKNFLLIGAAGTITK
jgi:hypothetical protein